MPDGAAKRTALKRLAQTFFGGSLPQMITELVAEESWTDGELDAMQDAGNSPT